MHWIHSTPALHSCHSHRCIEKLKECSPLCQESYCFFEDFLFRLFEVLGFSGFNGRRLFEGGASWLGSFLRAWNDFSDFLSFSLKISEVLRKCNRVIRPFAKTSTSQAWLLGGVRIFVIVESCRRLLKDEQLAFQQSKAQIQQKKRHLLPSVQAMRPGLRSLLIDISILLGVLCRDFLPFTLRMWWHGGSPCEARLGFWKCLVGPATVGLSEPLGFWCSRVIAGLELCCSGLKSTGICQRAFAPFFKAESAIAT